MIKTPSCTVIGGGFISATTVIGTKKFNPKSLFKQGEKGGLYPFRLNSFFQDVAGTIPAVVGSTVALVLDASGNGNHLIQSDSSKQPRLQVENGKYYLLNDGFDDFMQSQATIDMTHTSSISTVCKIRMTDNTRLGYVFNFGDYATQNGVLHLRAPQAAGAMQLGLLSRGATNATISGTAPSLTADMTVTTLSSPVVNTCQLTINGVTTSNAGAQGGGNYGNYTLYLGRLAGARDAFAGRIYGFIMIDRLLTDKERQQAEGYFK